MTCAKKWLALMLAALMVFATTPLSVFAAGEPVLTIDVADTADRGDEITVTVNITAADVTAIGIQIADSFDSNAFDFVSAEWLVDGKITDVDTNNLYAVYAADLDTALTADGAVFRYTLAVKDAAAYGEYALTPSVIIEGQDAVVPTAAITLAVDPANIMTIAENFEDINVTGTEGSYNAIGCTYPYGKALYFGRGTSSANATITFDVAGTAEDKALAFWFDTNGSGYNGEAAMSFIPYTTAGYGTTLKTGYTFYTVVDGVVAEQTISSNFTIKLPQDASGWVIMPMPADFVGPYGGTGAYYGTCQEIGKLYLEYVYYNNASMIIDQISFVKDVDAFKTLVSGDAADVPGYVDVGHDFVNGTCTKCSAPLFNAAQDFESATDESYVNGVTDDCATDYGQSVVFSYNADLGSGTASTNFQHITFDTVGTTEDEALVFYYDNTTSGKPAVLYFAPVSKSGGGTTIRTNQPVHSIINGTLVEDNTSIVNSNFTMTLPANSSGWIMMDIGRSVGAHTLFGSGAVTSGVTGIAAFAVRTGSTTSVALDQFGFVKSMDDFAALALSNANVDGYTGKHDWQDATCTEPKICKDCATIEGEALGHNYVNKKCSRCGEKQPLDTLYTVGYDFESELANVYTQVSCISPYGMAGKMASTTGATIPFAEKGTEDDVALVFWVSNRGNASQSSIQFFIYATATKDETGETVSGRPQRLVVGEYTTVSISGEIGSTSVKREGNLIIPGEFEGWVIAPFTDFEDHWSTDKYPVDLVPNTMVNMVFQGGHGGSIFDQIGFATDIDAFITYLLGKKMEPYRHNWVDETCITCGCTLFATVEDGSDVDNITMGTATETHSVESVGDISGHGKAIKWFRGSNGGASSLTLALPSGSATDEAIYFYVNGYDQLTNGSVGYQLIANMDENNDSINHAAVGESYFFIDEDGNVTQKTFTGSHIFSVTTDTAGWIVIPLGSFNGDLTGDTLENLYLSTETTYRSILYLDEFGYAGSTYDAVQKLAERAQMEHLGTSYNDKGNALRFGFTLKADGITLDNYQRNIENATVTINGETYQLVSFGAIISNVEGAALNFDNLSSRTKKIEANLLFDYSDGTAYFTCGIKNIPENKLNASLYARSYYVYLDEEGDEVVVYGDMYEQNLADRMAMDQEAA